MRGIIRVCLVGAVFAAASTGLAGQVDVELQPSLQVLDVGEVASVQLVLASDAGLQPVSAASVILQWDSSALRLLGLNSGNAAPLVSSGFPPDPFGLNELTIPADGDGIYVGLAPLGNPIAVSPAGTLFTTLRFEVLPAARETQIRVLPSGGSPPGATSVFDGNQPNVSITGDLGHAVIRVGCPGDLNGDGVVDVADLGAVLQAYGLHAGGDLDGDGDTDLSDLALVLTYYGQACSS